MPPDAVDAAIRAKLGLTPPAAAPGASPVPSAASQGSSPAPGQVALFQLTEAEVNELRSAAAQNTELRTQVSALTQEVGGLMSALEERGKREDEARAKIPTDEQLDDMPRSEAIRVVAGSLVQQEVNRLIRGLGVMATDLLEVKQGQEEADIRRAYPNVNIEKYRPQIQQLKLAMPRLSTLHALKILADPRELVPSIPDTTPASSAAPVDSGMGGSSAPLRPAPSPNEVTEADLQRGLVQAQKSGDTRLAERYIQMILSRRTDVPADRRQKELAAVRVR